MTGVLMLNVTKKQRNLPLSKVKINNAFWDKIQELVQEVVIPFQADILEDLADVKDKSHAVRNFRIAAGEEQGEYHGFPWQDTDVAKWLEAASYSITIKPDKALEARMDEMIRLVAKAQRPDGYLNTFFDLKEPGKEWTNMRDWHELYTFGHMIEAGVAHHQATGKDSLLSVVTKLAGYVANRFGPESAGKTRGYPGHQEIELALLRLYRITGKSEHLQAAKYFLDERGTEPNFFIEETRKNRPHEKHYSIENTKYNQSHEPVRKQTEAVGHSVRALYMYASMADLAAETNDTELYDACKALMDNMITKKMYITGGLGSTVHGEAFSPAYDLPNDVVYAETCASIAMCFFARRMLEIEPCGTIADVLERQIFNVILASMQQDGKRFFYVNPLEVVPGIAGVAHTHRHVLPTRPNWFACACCPPNVARMLLSLGRYAWGEGDNTVYSHFFVGGEAEFNIAGGIKITSETGYPWDGNTRYTMQNSGEFTFAVHIPSWCRDVKISITNADKNIVVTPDTKTDEVEFRNGYAYISAKWQAGDMVEIAASLPVLHIYSNLAVSGNAGQVALQRGPIVYCLEEEDNGNCLASLKISPENNVTEMQGEGLFDGAILLKMQGMRRQNATQELYSETKPTETPQELLAVPYYTWGNRTPGEMRVWIN